jgi:transposase
MHNVTLIGIDLAKDIFQVCGVDNTLQVVFNRTLRRNKLLEFIGRYPGVDIAMEACSGSNAWARALQQAGHRVRLLPPQHVKPFVRGNKNDRNDALAICEASRRPGIRFVTPRSLVQTDCLIGHRLRQRRVQARTQLGNQLRGFLNEYGIVVRPGRGALLTALPGLLEDADNALTPLARASLLDMWEEWQMLDARIRQVEARLEQYAAQQPVVQRLRQVHGIGKLISTAAWAVLGDGRAFRSGRHFAANLGLVPREHSSGGRQQLGGITKRGNRYLRFLLIQSGHTILHYASRHPEDYLSQWALRVAARRGHQVATVAVANKLARILWALVAHTRDYRPGGYSLPAPQA